jgi:hypothetical protein
MASDTVSILECDTLVVSDRRGDVIPSANNRTGSSSRTAGFSRTGAWPSTADRLRCSRSTMSTTSRRSSSSSRRRNDGFVSPVRVLASKTKDQLAERTLERRSPGSSVRVCPAAGDELAVPAKQRFRLERESRPRRLGSERLSDASSVRSARVSFGREACRGGSPAHAGGRGSPTPSSEAAAPTATPVVTGSGQRDTPTTRANSPPSTTARETNLASPTLGKAADEFANPTLSNQRDRVPRAHETP